MLTCSGFCKRRPGCSRSPGRCPFEVPALNRQNARPYEIGRPVKHHFENHDLVTEHGSQLIDVTGEVHGAVERADVQNGMALVYSPHTTCAVVINEHESGFIEDFNDLLADLAPEKG